MKAHRKRMVIITVDSIGELMKDYLGGAIPANAATLRLEFSAKENGKLALVYSSPDIPNDAKDIFAHFDLKRMYSVGGN